jgi:hypothetical protein
MSRAVLENSLDLVLGLPSNSPNKYEPAVLELVFSLLLPPSLP